MSATKPLTEAQALRAVAHPARLRLYELLATSGPASVSQLADRLGARVGTASYHLRQLAAYGYVEEARELGRDRRERWWRAVPGGIRWNEAELEQSVGGREALSAARRVLFGRQMGRLRQWFEEGSDYDEEWRDAAFGTDMLLSLSADELKQFNEELGALVHEWSSRGNAASPATGERREVFFFAHAFPFDDARK